MAPRRKNIKVHRKELSKIIARAPEISFNPGANQYYKLTKNEILNPPSKADVEKKELSASHKSAFTDKMPDLSSRYTILSKLGQGGSASVYKVKDNELDKVFAIKVLHPQHLPDNQAQLRFKQEAEAASCLTHPNLVAVYGSGLANDKAPYIVMDCLKGKTLAQVIRDEGPLNSARATDILEQCSVALVHMHMKGIVHRDIKPSNIFLSEAENGTDMVKIVDFGIAKIQAYKDSTHLTQTGEVFGSSLYMSPEQCRGEALDFRSDIYSLGCVAYEMLSGISPFAAPNPVKTIMKHLGGSVPSLEVSINQCQIPAALQSIVMRCLELEPKKRFQTADELLQQLVTSNFSEKLSRNNCEIFPSFYKRLLASLVDGMILFSLVLTFLSLLAITFKATGHWEPGIWDLLTTGFGGIIYFVTMLLIVAVLFGPSMATLFWLLTQVRFSNLLGQLEFPLAIVISFLYFLIFERSSLLASPGKKLFGLAVVNAHGQRLSYQKAIGRHLSKIFLIPLLNLENSIRVVRRMDESWYMRFLRYGKHLVSMLPNPPKPPTDDWSGTYIVNFSSLNNPSIGEHLEDQTKGLKNLNEISEKLKIIVGTLNYNIGLGLIITFSSLYNVVVLKQPFDPLSYFFWLLFLLIWSIPPFAYLRRFGKRKQQILKNRNRGSSLQSGL